MLQEILEWSGIQGDKTDSSSAGSSPFVWIDGTLGGAGHACSVIPLLKEQDQFVGVDRDPKAVERSEKRIEGIKPWNCRVRLVNASYKEIPEYIQEGLLEPADGITLDLGLSSDQLADRDRGFSFKTGGPLDLRFNTDEGISAAKLLHTASDQEIANIIYRYGEERFSRRIARAIVENRLENPIETAEQLYDLVHRVVPGKIHGRVDSATRTFQALRIAVNRELEHLEDAMKHLPNCLKPGGRLLIITFHSLEDRIVKHAFRDDPRLEVLTRKPLLPTEEEIELNPRARSAKLRIAKRI